MDTQTDTHASVLAFGMQRQEDQELKVTLSHTASSQLAYPAGGDPVTNVKTKEQTWIFRELVTACFFLIIF